MTKYQVVAYCLARIADYLVYAVIVLLSDDACHRSIPAACLHRESYVHQASRYHFLQHLK